MDPDRDDPRREPRPQSTAPLVEVWNVRSIGRAWAGALRYVGEWGVEFVLLRDGQVLYSHRFGTRDAALWEAEQQRLLVSRAWADVSAAVHINKHVTES